MGRVGRPHGTDGAFVVERASADDNRWQVGEIVFVDGVPARITLARRVGGGRRAICLDRPVERGAELALRRSELPPLEPDTYYAFELVGLQVVDARGDSLGTVADVHPGAANDNLELEGGMLVPLIEDAIAGVDLDGGRIVVNREFLG